MKKIKTVNKNERLKEFIVLNHQQNSTSKFLNKYKMQEANIMGFYLKQ